MPIDRVTVFLQGATAPECGRKVARISGTRIDARVDGASRLNRGACVVILGPVHGLIEADVFRFLAVVIAGGLLFVTHWIVARSLFGDPTAPRILRLLAIFPPLTPFVAFHLGKRAASILWIGVFAAYITVRIVID